MEVVVTTGAINRAKVQSNHHHQRTNTQFFTGRMPFLSPNQQRQSTKGKNITFHGLAYPKLTWGLPILSLTTNSSWLPYGGLPCLSSALWCQYPNIHKEPTLTERTDRAWFSRFTTSGRKTERVYSYNSPEPARGWVCVCVCVSVCVCVKTGQHTAVIK